MRVWKNGRCFDLLALSHVLHFDYLMPYLVLPLSAAQLSNRGGKAEGLKGLKRRKAHMLLVTCRQETTLHRYNIFGRQIVDMAFKSRRSRPTGGMAQKAPLKRSVC